ncbi:WxL domain-containing protein [Streptomyces sp. NPDC052052]|uniref:WxL domain-containing protein n=1 Tax=Streptomyces sp. NPDC052052 TaxID=3154756 RepID=UPI0034374D11
MRTKTIAPCSTRTAASLAALVVAAAGSLVLGGASPALAGSGAASYDCVFASSHSAFNTTATLTAADTTTAGTPVGLTLSFADGPANGPVALSANTVAVSAKVSVSGQDPVTLSAPASNPAVAAYAQIPIPALTGQLTVAQPGTVQLAPGDFTLSITNYGLSITCSIQGTPPVLSTVTVTDGSTGSAAAVVQSISNRPTADSTGARHGDVVTLGGTGWTAGKVVDGVELCGLDGTSACAADVLTSSLTVDGDGKLSGTVEIGAGATPGPHSLVISQGSLSATVPLGVLGTRAIQLSPSGGGPGTPTTVTGASFDPGDEVTVTGVDADGTPVGDTLTAPVNARGGFSATLTPVAGTVKILATEKHGTGADSAEAGWTALADGGSSEQTLKVVVSGGALTMSQDAGEVSLSPVTVDGTEHSSTGNLNAVEVKDFRGSTRGWSLVGTVTDFTNAAGASIPAGNLSWTPACDVHDGAAAASTVTAGSAGALSATTAAPLCTQAASDDPTSVTGGDFDANAALSLNVPAISQSGEYAAVLRLTLS